MNIIYMGTPEFAVAPLVKMVEAGYKVSLVVTQPDREKDRKNQVLKGAVHKKALELGLEVEQPPKIKGNSAFIDKIRALAPDVIVVAAYGKILPKELLEAPRLGCINIHGSLLPKYRGAAPIQWSIIKGDEFTGISIMLMDEGLDTGDVLAKEKTEVDHKTTIQLYKELSEMGAMLLVKTLPAIENGTAQRVKQNDEEATLAPIIHKSDGWIDFTKSAKSIECHVRGFNPWPGAFVQHNGQPLKILESEVLEGISSEAPGTITAVSKNGIDAATGNGLIRFTKVQAPGKKPMAVSEYLNGNKIELNAILETRKGE